MHIHNTYYYFPKALSDEQCQNILDIGKKQLLNEKNQGVDTSAPTFGRSEKGKADGSIAINDKTDEELFNEGLVKDRDTYTRDSEVTWLELPWLYEILANYVYRANKEARWEYDIDFHEPIQFTKYGLNQFYGWHTDGGSCHLSAYKKYIPGVTPDVKGERPFTHTENPNMLGKVRKLSMTVNLTNADEYEGGNLKFDFGPHSSVGAGFNKRFHECEEIRPKGSIIVFPSYMHHQVTPVTKGTRYSLVMWSLGKPFR